MARSHRSLVALSGLCAAALSIGCTGDARSLATAEATQALGAGALGPVATRAAPARRRLRAVAGATLRLELQASDAQGDLSGADVYVDGELAAQQHVGEVGGTGGAARFHHELSAAPGTHVVVAKAFDREDHYSEGVTWIVDAAAPRRALYVSSLLQLLDDATAADALVAFAAAHRIDAVVFYQVGAVFADARTGDLAALFARLRAAGVEELGAPIGGGSALDRVRTFNAEHPEVAFSLVVSEHEYWQTCAEPAGGYGHECPSCRSQCFPPFLALLQQMRALAVSEAALGRPLQVAAYLGYPSTAEAAQVAALVDRVYLNYHGASPDAAYGRSYVRWGAMRARLHAFGGGERAVEVWPIVYTCREANMRDWLAAHSLEAAEDAFLTRFADEGAPLVHDVVIGGFAYYRYDGFANAACP